MKDARSTSSSSLLPNVGIFGTTSNNNSSSLGPLKTKYDTKVFSGGMGFHLGYRLLFKDGFFLNFESIIRNSWVNKKEIDFPRVIKYISFQPRFQIGYRLSLIHI